MNDLTLAAITYLAAGQHLLALTGKRPNTTFHAEWDWGNSIHGLPESEEQEAALDAVFSHPTTTGVAILIPPHVLVADIDTEEAATLFLDLCGGNLPDTVTSKTPHGLHLWFLHPGADGSVWVGGRTLLFKGFGGYVVAPPSRVDDGVYTWITADPTEFVYDWLPDGIAERLKFERAIDGLKPVKTTDASGEYIQVEFTPGEHGGWRLWRRWHIEGLRRAIIDAPDGNQNNIIAWAAMQARDEGVPFDVAMPLLLDAAIKGNHPADRARATIKGAFKRAHRG